MKVICRRRSIPDDSKSPNVGYELTVGRAYVVLGISFSASEIWNKGVLCLLRDDFGRCTFAPISLVEVLSPKVSSLWLARATGEYGLNLWPAEFYEPFFHDDLSNGEPKITEKFLQVVEALEKEAAEVTD